MPYVNLNGFAMPVFNKPDADLTPKETRQIIDALHQQMDNEISLRIAERDGK